MPTPDSRQSGTSSSGATTLSWSHTVGAAADMILQVNSCEGSASNFAVSGVNWDQGGTQVALTLKGRINDGNSQAWAEIWRLLSPAPGTKTIQVTYAGSVACCTGSASYSGVDQAVPYNAASPQTAIGNEPAQPSVAVTSAVGELVTDCVIDNMSSVDTLVIGGGQTTIHNITVGTSIAGASSDEAGAASVTMSWTGVLSGAPWGIVGVSLRPSSGGGIAPQSGQWALNIQATGPLDEAVSQQPADSTGPKVRTLETIRLLPTTVPVTAGQGTPTAQESQVLALATAAGTVRGLDPSIKDRLLALLARMEQWLRERFDA